MVLAFIFPEFSVLAFTGGESVKSVSTSSKCCATAKYIVLPCPSCSELLHDNWPRREQVTSALCSTLLLTLQSHC